MAQGFAPPPPPHSSTPPLEAAAFIAQLQSCFADIQDPRVERTRLHQLSDIILIAVLSVIAGGQGWEDMEAYGLNKFYWLSTFLALPNGIPSEDTFRRVFERIHPQQFEACFEKWVQNLVQSLGLNIVSIDGKSLRGSYDRNSHQNALHFVSAWASEHRLVLAQTKVQDKSNEITAIPALLELIDLGGAIITIDAMGTQKTIATQIVQSKADYILCLKSNHPTLFEQVKTWFHNSRSEDLLPHHYEERIEAGHHRIETRKVWQVNVTQLPCLYQQEEWEGLQTIVVVERTRRLWNKTTHEVQFYLTSLSAEDTRIATAIRQHWGIENSVHWTLDVTFGEDHCRVRRGHGPHNLGVLRRIALNCLNRETTYKHSLRQKVKRAGMNDTYMMTILSTAFPNSALPLELSCQ
jgi:predicted transposase YbfD/YdcC